MFTGSIPPRNEPAFKETSRLAFVAVELLAALIVFCTCLTSLYNLTRSQNRHRPVKTSTPPKFQRKGLKNPQAKCTARRQSLSNLNHL